MHSATLRPGDSIADTYRVVAACGETALWVGYLVREASADVPLEGLGPPQESDLFLKILRPELFPDRAAQERVLNELPRTPAAISPGLPGFRVAMRLERYETVAVIENLPPEVAEHGSLLRELFTTRAEDYSATEMRAIAQQVAQALRPLHALARSHGDLRPETIRFGEGGAILCDFGLAACLPHAQYLEALRRRNELEFLAPEAREGTATSERTDVYGLAKICFFLITAVSGFEWTTQCLKHPALVQIFDHALHENPSARQPSVAAFLDELERAFSKDRPPTRPDALLPSIVGALPESGPRGLRSGRIPSQTTSAPGLLGPAEISGAPRTNERVNGWLGIDAPTEIARGGTELVRGMAVRSLLEKALIEAASEQEQQLITQARLAKRIRMELCAMDPRDFAIRALCPDEQPVAGNELTVWEWLVTAQQLGEAKTLLLTITNLLDEDGQQLEKALPSRRLTVHVRLQPAPLRRLHTTEKLAQLVRKLIPQEPVFDKFCRTRFPQLCDELTLAEGYRDKLSLVLTRVPSTELVDALRSVYPGPYSELAPEYAVSLTTPIAASPAALPGAAPPLPARAALERPRESFASPSQPQPEEERSLRTPHRASARPQPSMPVPKRRSSSWRWALGALGISLPLAIAGLRWIDFSSLLATQKAPQAEAAATRALVPIDAPKPTASIALGKSYAVLFATSHYEDARWPALKTPAVDVHSVADDLRSLYDFEVEILTDPGVEDIRKTIHRLAERTYAPGDQLFLLFAGHGDKDDTLRKGWIVARDSRAADRRSAYPYSELREDIDNIPCSHILLILDVCFGGAFDPSLRDAQTRGREYQEASREAFIERKLRYRSRLYIASVDQNTEAVDGVAHSPFAWKFLEALRSSGGSDGVLTWNELVGFLEKLQPEPRGGVFPRSPNVDPGGDFLFVRKPR